MNPARPVLAGLLCAVAGITWGTAGASSDPYGQVLFSPASGMPDVTSASSGDSALVIFECSPTTEGLVVRGHVPANGGTVQIVVTTSSPDVIGVRIGAGWFADVPLGPGAVPGDFRVKIPWAGKDSLFVVAGADVGTGPEDRPMAGVSCPADADRN